MTLILPTDKDFEDLGIEKIKINLNEKPKRLEDINPITDDPIPYKFNQEKPIGETLDELTWKEKYESLHADVFLVSLKSR